MTTQYTHDDQHDVDTSVVEHSYDSETSASPTASTDADSTEVVGQAPEHEAQEQPEMHESHSVDSTHASDTSATAHIEETIAAPQAVDAAVSTPVTATTEEHTTQEPAYSAPTSTTDEDTAHIAATDVVASEQSEPVASSTQEQSAAQSNETHVEQEQPTVAIDEPVAVEPLLVEADEAAPTIEGIEASEASALTEPVELPPFEALPLLEAQAEEVRPFTSFIEEFNEEARRLREAQAETLSLLATSQELAPEIALDSAEDLSSIINSTGTIDAAEGVAPEEALAIIIETEAPTAMLSEDVTAVQETPTTPETMVAPPKPLERPVSPLLRPALRPRVPRHGVIRQREESVSSENTLAAQTAGTPTTPVEQEAPRPQRRYRFDNRSSATNNGASSNATVTPAQPATSTRGEDTKEPFKSTAARVEQSQGTPTVNGETSIKSSTTNDSVTEQPEITVAAKQPAIQEPVTETTTPVSPISEQDRRRRHGHERTREKEQPVALPETASTPVPPATVADVAALIEPETSAPAVGDVAPEDMPPLEYAELQKANSRRRRRHRPAPVNGTAVLSAVAPTVQVSKPVLPPTPTVVTEQPAAQATPPAVTTANAPRSIGPAAPSSSQYGIVSGYTVNQMNQSTPDVSGPFMGPEPSPARGSVITRDGRTTRAESQRSPVYPVARTSEPTVSSTSLQQLASVLSQSIQTQTDRMVAELRRANQAPTSVSVNLPPFPSTERVGVFVDVANLLYSARTLRMGVDFGKLLDFLRGNRRLVRAQAYCPTSPQAGDEQMFLQAVKGLGYRITTKNYKTFSSGAKKADLDLDLCMDVVRLVDGRAVDCIVLVSGDSDFMPMLDYCSDHGVRVEVAAFDEAMSATLRQSCDLFINLSMLEEIRA